jgi:MFS family permease
MSEFQFGIQEGATSVGFVIGSLVMATIAGRLYEGQWLTIGYIGMGLLGIAYSQSTAIPAAIIILFFSGMMNAPASIARRLIIQRQSPREMRGRVSSAFFVSRDVLYLIGMAAAVLADIVDIRLLYLVASVAILLTGLLAQFLPGLRHGAAEWRDSLHMLRAAPIAPGLDAGRLATPADLDLLIGFLPQLGALSADEREQLLRGARVVEAQANTAVIRYGDDSDAAYFLLAGAAFAGLKSDGEGYRSLETHKAGDFFGEIAALTGSRRTADVIITEQSTLLQMSNPEIGPLILSKMTERLTHTTVKDLPRLAGYDQREIRELRTAEAEG